jgi:hypothetical protein
MGWAEQFQLCRIEPNANSYLTCCWNIYTHGYQRLWQYDSNDIDSDREFSALR